MCQDMFATWSSRWCFLLVFILSVSKATPQDEELEALCSKFRNRHITRHPHNCNSYVECLNGYPVTRYCGVGLHYNLLKGVCDYPEEAGCIPAYESRRYSGPSLHREPEKFYPSGNHGNRDPPGQGSSPRPTYEETVYGARSRRPRPRFSPNQMRGFGNSVMRDAKAYVRKRMQREYRLYKDMYDVVDSVPFTMVARFLNAKPYAKIISQSGVVLMEAMKLMNKRFDIGDVSFKHSPMSGALLKPLSGTYRPDEPMPILPDIDYCPYPRLTCDPHAPYRTTDGSCNNLRAPLWGRSFTPFTRMAAARYDDGIEAMRKSVTGRHLPGARHVSRRLFPDADIPEDRINMLMVFWGQLMDHDMTLTAITEVPSHEDMSDSEPLKCGFDGCQTNAPGLEACWPIPVPEDDSDFAYNRCLKFVRSVEVPPMSCRPAPREQLNQATHWLDCSMVYGTLKEEADQLRDTSDKRRGRMMIRRHPDRRGLKSILPGAEVDVCRDINNTHSCFLAGDERVNENSGLTVYHTAIIREHNRIEDALHRINPHWSGERLHQETRRIVIAMTQHITFNEWLPLALGPDNLHKHGLEIQSEGYYQGYNPDRDPRIPNSFATAAFRFGHTLLQERMRRADVHHNFDDDLFLSETFFRPASLYHEGSLDSFARGLANLPCQSYDQFFTKQVTRSLFTERPPFGPGMDLMSLNVQRGRDHGLPTYNDMRAECGLGRAKTFQDLSREVTDPRALEGLRAVYDHVDDIDLFPGGSSEHVVPGGLVGPTFACVIGRTFSRLRQGDRFWYENHNEAGFTPEQLNEIRKATASRLICANMDNVQTIQKWLFMLPSKPGPLPESGLPLDPDFQRFFEKMNKILGGNSNPRVPCDSLPDPDLTLWKERPGY